MNFTLQEEIQGLMIFIDFHKALDSLEWNFLVTCLQAFNFGTDFVAWVATFYKNKKSCVLNNGNSSDYFYLKRGVRQGDPVSPYLFDVTVEILGTAIRQNSLARYFCDSV